MEGQHQKAPNEKVPVGYEEILQELNFYKSLFVTNRRSMIGNLRIKTKKGEIINTSIIAGILGAKKTSEIIPLSHNIIIEKIDLLR